MRGEASIAGTWTICLGPSRLLLRAVPLAAEAGDSRARYSAMRDLVDAKAFARSATDGTLCATPRVLVAALRLLPFESTLTLARQNLVLAHVSAA